MSEGPQSTKELTISEQLMYSTVKIDTSSGSGTGFLFTAVIESTQFPLLVTNKHVVNHNVDEDVKLIFHIAEVNGTDAGNVEVSRKLHWHFHSTYDLCFAFINPIFVEIEKITGKKVRSVSIDPSLIPSQKQLENLSAVEEVLMVGYPNGLIDQLHNFPIFRYGHTATHPAFDFNGDKIALLDIAAYPGSSGSPVFIYNPGAHTSGSSLVVGSRVYFLGILFAGPSLPIEGQVVPVEIPTDTRLTSLSNIMINLGYYIKSEAMNEFIEWIKINEFPKIQKLE